MAQAINHMDLRSRGPGFDSGSRPNVFYYTIFIKLFVFQYQKLVQYSMTVDEFLSRVPSSEGPLNIIDLAPTKTKNRNFTAPTAIQDISMAHVLDFECDQNKYLLLSQAGSLTPWHVDYSNTCVYYYVVQGKKDFFCIPGNTQTRASLETWCKESQQENLFLPSDPSLKHLCFGCTVSTGEAIVMPAGMIHMVRTRKHTIAVGVNFLGTWDLG